jgi:hypothetical protein
MRPSGWKLKAVSSYDGQLWPIVQVHPTAWNQAAVLAHHTDYED